MSMDWVLRPYDDLNDQPKVDKKLFFHFIRVYTIISFFFMLIFGLFS